MIPTLLTAILLFSTTALVSAQDNQPATTPPAPATSSVAPPPRPALSPNVGPQRAPNFDIPSAGAPGILGGAGMPGIPKSAGIPGASAGAPAGMGAGPMSGMPPDVEQRTNPPASAFVRPAAHGPARIIASLEPLTPYVQAFDFVLMLIAGIFCLRARRAPGLTILAISCFVSAVILLGFFLFGFFQGQGAFPQIAYLVARLLAPFELILFFIGIILVARRPPPPDHHPPGL